MKDIRPKAEERARQRQQGAPPGTTRPPDSGFMSERTRAKEALRSEVNTYTGENVRKIAATTSQAEEDRVLRVAAYCRVSTDDIDQLVSIELQKNNYRDMIRANPKWKYESKGQNLVPDGLKPGEQIQVNVSGRYLRTPNQTLYTVEFVADGETYAIRTLHVEDLFNVLYLKGTDAVSGATVVSFTNPDGSAQQVEEVEAPGEDEIVTRTYTLENAMDKEITELYVYKSRGENLVPDGLQPGEQVQAEVFGYYLHTPNETLYTVEYTTEGDKFVNTYSIRTLHVEDLFEVLYLTGADAVAGATPVAFTAPEK